MRIVHQYLKFPSFRSNGFDDPWKEQKKIENDQSIKLLASRLTEIDNINVEDERWIELFRGVLAGNLFDFGAKAVQKIIEENQNFGLQDALTKIQPRPWLFDGIDKWLERMKVSLKNYIIVLITKLSLNYNYL